MWRHHCHCTRSLWSSCVPRRRISRRGGRDGSGPCRASSCWGHPGTYPGFFLLFQPLPAERQRCIVQLRLVAERADAIVYHRGEQFRKLTAVRLFRELHQLAKAKNRPLLHFSIRFAIRLAQAIVGVRHHYAAVVLWIMLLLWRFDKHTSRFVTINGFRKSRWEPHKRAF